MKSIIKIMSTYALLVAASNCYGAEQGIIKQTITIKNNTDKTIFGGIYLTSAAGRIYNKEAKPTRLVSDSCITTTIDKSQKIQDRIFKYYKIIFSDNEADMVAKIASNNRSNIVSTAIKQLSKSKPLYYLVNEGESLLTKNKELKIKKEAKVECSNFTELAGRAEAGLEAVSELVIERAQAAGAAINRGASAAKKGASDAYQAGKRLFSSESSQAQPVEEESQGRVRSRSEVLADVRAKRLAAEGK